MSSELERLLERAIPEPNTGCWLWMGAYSHRGYGVLSVRTKGKSKVMQAHRRSYELSLGTIPDGMQIDHLCGISACVNPNHLEAVTQLENIRRRKCTHYGDRPDLESAREAERRWRRYSKERSAAWNHSRKQESAPGREQ